PPRARTRDLPPEYRPWSRFRALAQRSLFTQLQSLSDIVRPQHGDLRRVHGFHLAKNEVLSKLAAAHHHHSAARTAHAMLTRSAASSRHDQCGQVLISGAFRADENHVPHLKIREEGAGDQDLTALIVAGRSGGPGEHG